MSGMRRKSRVIRTVFKHRIHPGHHCGRTASGFVLRKRSRVVVSAQPFGGGRKQTRVSTSKTIDGLLGVAHQKHRGAVAVSAIGIQPGAQNAPLQGVGVLKLIQEQMLPARVQFHEHGGGIHLVFKQSGHFQLGIGEIQPALFSLEPMIGAQIGLPGCQYQAVKSQCPLVCQLAQCALHVFGKQVMQFNVTGCQCAQSVLHGAGELERPGVAAGQQAGTE